MCLFYYPTTNIKIVSNTSNKKTAQTVIAYNYSYRRVFHSYRLSICNLSNIANFYNNYKIYVFRCIFTRTENTRYSLMYLGGFGMRSIFGLTIVLIGYYVNNIIVNRSQVLLWFHQTNRGFLSIFN